MSERVLYVKASVERKPQYRQYTLIMADEERRFVRKVAACPEAGEHLGSYARNYRTMTAALHPGSRITLIPCMENPDGSVDFPFCDAHTLSDELAGKNADDYAAQVLDYRSALTDAFGTAEFTEGEAFRDIFGRMDLPEGLSGLTIANPDMNFDNVFCTGNGEMAMIDYEWLFSFPLPLSFQMYRALLLDPTYQAFDPEEQERIQNAIGVDEKLEAKYQEMELAFLRFISPEEYKLDYFARTPGAVRRTIHDFQHLLTLPAENQKLSEDLRQELQEAVRFSDALKAKTEELKKEQEHSTELSDELGRTQEDLIKTQGDLIKTQGELGQTQSDLKRETETAVWLSGELGRTQDQLTDQIALYNKYASRIWYRVFRRIEAGKERIRDGIRKFARQRNIIGKGCSFLLILFREGPKAAFHKAGNHLSDRQSRKQFVQSLQEETRTAESMKEIPQDIKFSLLVPLYNTPKEFLVEMIESVQKQKYTNWELCLADGSDPEHTYVGETCREMAEADPRIVYRKLTENKGISENTNACIDMATGEYIGLFDHDDLLHPMALYENAKAILEQGADFLYSDEFVFASPDIENVIATHFKPDFAPDSLLSNNYICHFSVFKTTLLGEAGRFRKECDGSQDHDIILRLTGCARKVAHIPKVLYFWRSHAASTASDIATKTYAIDGGRFAVRDFLEKRKGIRAKVESTEAYPTMYHVSYPIEGEPEIDLILDLTGTGADAAETAAELCRHTDYRRLSLTFISEKEQPEITGLPYPVRWIRSGARTRPERYNAAAQGTEAGYLVLMEPGLKPSKTSWLTEMLMLAQQKHIGAVGARILFEDGTLRHGGLITGFGSRRLIGRSHFGISRDNTGYFGQMAIVGDVSAVSAECMMISREKLEEAGGFDTGFEETLFDADLCLRLREKGYLNVCTPFAELRGGEPGRFSMDYGTERTQYEADAAVFADRWKELLGRTDPYYNPNLTLDFSDYRIRA